MSVVVRLEGAPFSLTDTPDADGDRFRVAEIEGLDGMDTEINLTNLYGSGSAFTNGRYPKREILVRGIALSSDKGEYSSLRLRRKLERWAADWAWNQRWLYVDEPSPGIPTQLKTRPGGKPSFPVTKGGNQTFEIPFTCADPRKYSQTQQQIDINGSGTLTNNGDFPTFVFATCLSGTTSPYLRNVSTGNQSIILAGNVPINTTVDFLARRTMFAGNVLQEMAQRPRVWWQLIPGANTIETASNWRFQFRDAYR